MLVERAVDGFLLLNTPADHIEVPVPVVAISAHSAVENVTNIVLDHHAPSSRRSLISMSSAIAASPSCAARAPFPTPSSAGKAFSRWPAKSGLQHRPRPCHPHRRRRLVHEDRIPPHGPRNRLQAHAGPARKARDFTAIFCFNDIAAIGAIRALKDAGLSVPGDVSVVGFDDILSAAYSTPSLTTVRQPLLEMGKRGAQVLLDRIANRENDYPAEIVMAPELVVRESTGPAPTATKA